MRIDQAHVSLQKSCVQVTKLEQTISDLRSQNSALKSELTEVHQALFFLLLLIASKSRNKATTEMQQKQLTYMQNEALLKGANDALNSKQSQLASEVGDLKGALSVVQERAAYLEKNLQTLRAT